LAVYSGLVDYRQASLLYDQIAKAERMAREWMEKHQQ